MGLITLILLLGLETFFLLWSIFTKRNHSQEKSVIRIAVLILFGIFLITGILEWGFRYDLILLVLMIQAIVGIVILVRKIERDYRFKKTIFRFVKNCIVFSLALFIAILCPQYKQPQVTGNLKVATAKYTWVDQNRIETFSKKKENRALTVEFWYPKTKKANETYPLVVFSHGAFGFSGSNHSTFEELASHGYVVASIGHTYHAFYTLDTSGKLTIVNTDFLNSVYAINAMDDVKQAQEIFDTEQKWMKLRTDDENFVLDTILSKTKGSKKANSMFSLINPEKIGLFGHSLGGASAAELGRERTDIDAVIDLDGTMLGEETGVKKDGKAILIDTPYPVPLLNIYAEDHYTNAKKLVGDDYDNFVATKNARCADYVVIKNAGHLNFTDLPLFSPILAKKLGVGTVDARYCIDTTNKIVLQFFNGYLKDKGTPNLKKEYSF